MYRLQSVLVTDDLRGKRRLSALGDEYTRTVVGEEVSRGERLPALDPFLGYLPPRQQPYLLTWGEIHEMFVARAPFRERRQRIYSALQLFAESIWELIPDARLWINGGFTTQKDWAAPDDVDVVVLGDAVPPQIKAALLNQGLLTLEDVTFSVNAKTMHVSALKTFGGLVDAYLADVRSEEVWRAQWSRVKGPDGKIMDGVKKGFVEVVRGI